MTTGEKIAQLVKVKGSNLRQISIKAGVPYNTLYAIVQRKSSKIDPETLKKIASALEVPWYELYGDGDVHLVSIGMVEGMRMATNRPVVLAEEQVLKVYRDKGYQFTEEEAACVKEFRALNDLGQLAAILAIRKLSNMSQYKNDDLNSETNKED